MKRTPLVRRAPLKQRAPIARSTKRIRPNKARKARLFVRNYHSDEYREWLVSQYPCSVAGCPNRDVIAAHAKSKGAGGDWRDLFPLCNAHHSEQHDLGIRTWRAKYAIEPDIIARCCVADWEQRMGDLPEIASDAAADRDRSQPPEGEPPSGGTSEAESGNR